VSADTANVRDAAQVRRGIPMLVRFDAMQTKLEPKQMGSDAAVGLGAEI
jgi:hypothetical protein